VGVTGACKLPAPGTPVVAAPLVGLGLPAGPTMDAGCPGLLLPQASSRSTARLSADSDRSLFNVESTQLSTVPGNSAGGQPRSW
jgi:hypothetical protein